MNLSKYLCNFWLTSLESDIYEKSISVWLFPASEMARIIKIPRSTARYTCESLVQKGFLTMQEKWNTKYFLSENPTKLFAIINQEEEKLKEKKSQLHDAVKELQGLYNPLAKIPKITMYEGKDGIEKMYDELIQTPTDLYSFWAWDYFISKEKTLIESFRKKSQKTYKTIYVIRSPKYKDLHQNDTKKMNTRYFEGIDELKVDIQIVQDKMSIISLWEPKPIWIMIKHKEIVEAFENIFKEIWKKLD